MLSFKSDEVKEFSDTVVEEVGETKNEPPLPKSVDGVARYICDQLHDAGFVIQRYNSMTTNSVYIKIDYGVGHSIRVGDHPGKAKYSYRYNIGSHFKRVERKGGHMPRNYYPMSKVCLLIEDIKRAKKDAILKKSEFMYKCEMTRMRSINQGAKGFWSSARFWKTNR